VLVVGNVVLAVAVNAVNVAVVVEVVAGVVVSSARFAPKNVTVQVGLTPTSQLSHNQIGPRRVVASSLLLLTLRFHIERGLDVPQPLLVVGGREEKKRVQAEEEEVAILVKDGVSVEERKI